MSDRVLDAAKTLLEESGEGFTMAQLEAETKLSRATLYRRIGSKEALLERLARERGESFEPEAVGKVILQAAREVFGREGLVAATIEQIAGEAGVGVATVYRHFGDKDTLVKTFVKEMTPRHTVSALALNPSDDVQADLEQLISVLLPFVYENRNIVRMVLMGNEQDRQYLQALRKDSESTQKRLAAYFAAQVEAGRLTGEPDELALALVGIVTAFAVLGPLQHGRALEDIEQTGKRIVQLFLSDLRCRT